MFYFKFKDLYQHALMYYCSAVLQCIAYFGKKSLSPLELTDNPYKSILTSSINITSNIIKVPTYFFFQIKDDFFIVPRKTVTEFSNNPTKIYSH